MTSIFAARAGKAKLIAVLFTMGVCVAGCGSAPSAIHTSRSTTFPAVSSSASPQAEGTGCPFLTIAQVQDALRQRVRRVKGCAYSFARGAGSLGVLTQTYSSPQQAQVCRREGIAQDSRTYGHGFKVTRIPTLGPEAISLVLPHTGIQAAVIRGNKSLSVAILWPPAAQRSQLAVMLLREAAAHFEQYSAPLMLGCA